MRRLPGGRWTPAVLVAIVAMLLGGGAYALAASSGGGTITACVKKRGGALYVASKCGKREKKLSWNNVGPAGALGSRGLQGVQGPKGDTGAQGPGATTLTFDADATASPTPTVVGTVLGVTVSADCRIPATLPAGQAKLETLLQTATPWSAAFGAVSDTNGTNSTFSSRTDVAAGALTTPQPAASVSANPPDGSGPSGYESHEHLDLIQMVPQKGHVVWHLTAKTTATPASKKCQLVIQSFPSN
jgi:hypothetical protein